MQKRNKMKKRVSKKVFKDTANQTHKFNTPKPGLKRGGIRL